MCGRSHPGGEPLRILDVTDLQTLASPGHIAVIGSGVAGLTAAYLLSQRHRVTLLEADTPLGGHAHTHRITASDG